MSINSNTHNDSASLLCNLERDTWRNAITQQIINAQPPKVIAVHGTWGMGKTSLMAQIYRDLGGDHAFKPLPNEVAAEKKRHKFKKGELAPIKPIWFEAWQYQHEPNILAALLKEIRDQLALPHKVWEAIDETAVVGLFSTLQSIDLTFDAFGVEFGIKDFATKFDQNFQRYQKERGKTPLNSVHLKQLLQDAIDKLLNLKFIVKNPFKQFTKNKKAVIFIDDLDRCEPHIAFKVLESIKVYLDLDNCIFVLGMDVNAVDRILAKYYEKQLNPSGSGGQELRNLSRLYLEKICQDIYHLPIPTNTEKLGYFQKLLAERIDLPEPIRQTLFDLVNRYQILPPFPRSIKILANVVITHLSNKKIKTFLGKTPEEYKIKAFLIISYLYAFHFEVYQLCYLYPNFYNQAFLEYCKNPRQFKHDKGGHPELENMIMPTDKSDTEEVLSGSTQTEKVEDLISRTYPHTHLRQVLWIRRMIKETGSIPIPDLEKLKL